MQIALILLPLLIPYLLAFWGAYYFGTLIFRRFQSAFASSFGKAALALTAFIVIELILRKLLLLGTNAILKAVTDPGSSGAAIGAISFIFGPFLGIGLHVLLLIVLISFVRSSLRFAKQNPALGPKEPSREIFGTALVVVILLAAIIAPRYESIAYLFAPQIGSIITKGATSTKNAEICSLMNYKHNIRSDQAQVVECVFSSSNLPREEYENTCGKLITARHKYLDKEYVRCVKDFAKKHANKGACELMFSYSAEYEPCRAQF